MLIKNLMMMMILHLKDADEMINSVDQDHTTFSLTFPEFSNFPDLPQNSQLLPHLEKNCFPGSSCSKHGWLKKLMRGQLIKCFTTL